MLRTPSEPADVEPFFSCTSCAGREGVRGWEGAQILPKPVEPARERSELLSRNHRWHPVTRTRPQVPEHPQDGFDTGCSFIAARLNQLVQDGFDTGCSQAGSTGFGFSSPR
ncbi:hypothetical protein FBF34_02040 [Arachnia propionica]|nr:hypothetical protein FBF34_02040 [Arachnia propionica]RPA17664.1 hypothetical protein EGT56_06535 [Arachnia propionica]